MSTMAEVLAAHRFDREKAVCTCSNEVQVGLRCDKQTHPEHVAEVLTKAGYGKLADAWDEGRRVGHAHPYTQFTATPCPSNPYGSAS